MVRFAVLTSSDMGSSGKRADTSGDIAVEMMMAAGHQLVDRAITPDERPRIIEYLKRWSFSGEVDVILTTGGTGLGPRDVTPEATMDVLEYQVPGMAETMRAESLRVTPMAMISRAVAGVRGKTLIINLPGSPGGVTDNLAVVLPVLTHAVEILRDRHTGEHPV
jgi:molybdopterin adenylyltransferase